MQELEALLTSLIQRGRKPKDRKVVSIKLSTQFTKSEDRTIFCCSCKDGSWFYADLRWIVSLESGLWQFVCDNKMVYSSSFIEWQKWGKQGATLGLLSMFHKYRLLESALIPEEELAKFLLDNIKIEGK